ncbi:MAG: class I SAM-dependent methyltransferase [Bacilli bacterium]|nr:class I SAM-dependent methyltransferase [Bacilli bacterium]
MNQYFENNKELKSEINKINTKVKDTNFIFYTDNGVFNKKGLDYGTKLLLENIDLNNKNTFLDVGCGCGPIGIYIGLLNNNYTVDMIDINERAIHLCNMSKKENKLSNINIFKSDIYENVNNKYDCVITNPPIHAGKKKVYEIIEHAKEYLNKNGEIWIVIRKDQGAKALMNDFKDIYNFEIIKKDKGFYIIKGLTTNN